MKDQIFHNEGDSKRRRWKMNTEVRDIFSYFMKNFVMSSNMRAFR